MDINWYTCQMVRLNAKELRNSSFVKSLKDKTKNELTKNEIYIVLDNVLDTYNIGSIFRLADAVAAKKIYLCAGSETPPNHRIKKASINTTEWVDWEYCGTAVEAIERIRKFSTRSNKNSSSTEPKANGEVQIVSVEQSSKSIPYNKFEYKMPLALVVGHESDGVSKEVMDACDGIVEIPMFGVNISLNVMVSLGIVLYKVIEKAN